MQLLVSKTLIKMVNRMENMKLHKASGKAKVMGTVVCISGAMLLTFYRGQEVQIWSSKIDLFHLAHPHAQSAHAEGSSGSFALGATLTMISCFCYAVWIVLLVFLLNYNHISLLITYYITI